LFVLIKNGLLDFVGCVSGKFNNQLHTIHAKYIAASAGSDEQAKWDEKKFHGHKDDRRICFVIID
jgi:hypothetical protein